MGQGNDAVILFDAAYECFVTEKGLARSIFEVEGAKEVAIEVCSFSKIAGFTGTRCGYTIVPQALAGGKLNKMWLRRQTTKFNGVAYVVQRGAEAVFTEEGMREIQQNLDYYRTNAAVIASALDEAGIWYCGGKNSPYLWLRCPNGMGSWEFFDWLLENAHVVGTPGEGFGPCGKGYFRLTAFAMPSVPRSRRTHQSGAGHTVILREVYTMKPNEEIMEFLKENPTFYLATVDGYLPRVRPIGFAMCTTATSALHWASTRRPTSSCLTTQIWRSAPPTTAASGCAYRAQPTLTTRPSSGRRISGHAPAG